MFKSKFELAYSRGKMGIIGKITMSQEGSIQVEGVEINIEELTVLHDILKALYEMYKPKPLPPFPHEEHRAVCSSCENEYCLDCHREGCPSCKGVHYTRVVEEGPLRMCSSPEIDVEKAPTA